MFNSCCVLKVSEITKAAAGTEESSNSSDSREAETKLKAAGSSSSLYPEELQGFTSASQVYSVRGVYYSASLKFERNVITLLFCSMFLQMKRKRVGAGQRGASACFQSAKHLLNPSDNVSSKVADSGGFFSDSSEESDFKRVRVKETKAETKAETTSSIRARASLNSPTKGGRAVSRKQQKLAEAAKSSRSISQYFVEKKPADQESCEVAELPPEGGGLFPETFGEIFEENIRQELNSLAAEEATESEHAVLETEDLVLVEPKTEVIVLSDVEEEETENKETLTPAEDLPHPDTSTATPYTNLRQHFCQTLLANVSFTFSTTFCSLIQTKAGQRRKRSYPTFSSTGTMSC